MRLLLHADASRQWEPAATIAARLARATGGSVTVVTAERIKRRQQEVVRRADQLLGLPKPQFAVVAEPGLVEQVVPAVANRGAFDCLVLAPLGGLDWLTHGHIVARIVAHSRPSVLLARGGAVGYTKALVCTEGPGHGAKDLDAALALAAVFDMEVHVLHVLSQIALVEAAGAAGGGKAEADFLASDHEVAAHLRELRSRIAQAHVRGDAKVRVGPVQDEILAEVRQGGHDLLVIGAHARSADGALTRDIASWLVRHCPVSTLVVREPWDVPVPGRRP
jgi:nucleotide-binding universal stress UspA family protein